MVSWPPITLILLPIRTPIVVIEGICEIRLSANLPTIVRYNCRGPRAESQAFSETIQGVCENHTGRQEMESQSFTAFAPIQKIERFNKIVRSGPADKSISNYLVP